MHKAPTIAIILIAISCLFTPARAQIVYKCGESYSAQACPGGVIVNVTDQRTSDQKDQADRATTRDLKTANALESARLQQEAKDLAANTPAKQELSIQPKSNKRAVHRDKKIKTIRIKAPPAHKTATQSAQEKTAKKIAAP